MKKDIIIYGYQLQKFWKEDFELKTSEKYYLKIPHINKTIENRFLMVKLILYKYEILNKMLFDV